MSRSALHITFNDDLTPVTICYEASTDQQERQLREIAELMIESLRKECDQRAEG